MLYLGIDQHARQVTISLRDEEGDVVQARQVSTEPNKINDFFQQLTRERIRNGEPFVAVLEVCGFNDWLIRMLQDYRCHRVILIQPDDRKKRKTDRRDAAALSELLNRSCVPWYVVFPVFFVGESGALEKMNVPWYVHLSPEPTA
jgi:transposase